MPVTTSVSRSVDAPVRSSFESLQGSWAAIAGPRAARLLIAGNHYTVEFIEGPIYMGAFTVDESVYPPEMDMRVEEGPARHRGRVARCIFLIDGELLRWCPAEPGSGECPSFFPSTDDDRFLSMVFQRARAPRPR